MPSFLSVTSVEEERFQNRSQELDSHPSPQSKTHDLLIADHDMFQHKPCHNPIYLFIYYLFVHSFLWSGIRGESYRRLSGTDNWRGKGSFPLHSQVAGVGCDSMLWKKQDGAGSGDQLAEHLPSVHKTLSLIPTTACKRGGVRTSIISEWGGGGRGSGVCQGHLLLHSELGPAWATWEPVSKRRE